MRTLIQPVFEKLEEYSKYAEQNDLYFEVVDFAYISNLDGNPTQIIDKLQDF